MRCVCVEVGNDFYQGTQVREFPGKFFARGPDPSPTLKVPAILEVEARKTLRKVLDIP